MNESATIRPKKPIIKWQNSVEPRLTVFSINGTMHGLRSAKTKKIKKSIRKTATTELKNYCKHTTLHGLKYLGDSHLTFGERIFWFVSFFIAIGLAIYCITIIYDKWQSNPVIISFSPFDADLKSIPFPTVTICNTNHVKKNVAEDILANGSYVDKKLLDYACETSMTYDNGQNVSWDAMKSFLVRVSNNCSDILKSCKWGDQFVNCDDIFNNELTDDGICCSFNRLPPKIIFRNMSKLSILNQTYPNNVHDWNPEKGFKNLQNEDYIPRKPLGAGVHLGLTVVMDAQIDNYYCSNSWCTGFKVLLSNPIETPKMSKFGFLISPGLVTRVIINPSIRGATESLRKLPIYQRQCYFRNERYLQYYRSYSQRNCLLECESNHTLKEVGCIPFYLPKDVHVRYCTQTDHIKVQKARKEMEENWSSCDCLPSCFSLQYTHSKSYSQLASNLVGKHNLNFTNKYARKNMAHVSFFFGNYKFSKQVKSEFFGFTDILSSTGGLLSLCMGFSLLSLMEVFYYIILRTPCQIARRKRLECKRRKLKVKAAEFLK